MNEEGIKVSARPKLVLTCCLFVYLKLFSLQMTMPMQIQVYKNTTDPADPADPDNSYMLQLS